MPVDGLFQVLRTSRPGGPLQGYLQGFARRMGRNRATWNRDSLCINCFKPVPAKEIHSQQKNIPLASLSAIVLYGIAYRRLPQEAGYLIPLVPFVIMLAAISFTEQAFRVFTIGVSVSALALQHQQT